MNRELVLPPLGPGRDDTAEKRGKIDVSESSISQDQPWTPDPEELERRLPGIQNLLRFLRKAFNASDINDYKSFSEQLCTLDKDQLRGLLVRVNGLTNRLSLGERSQAEQETHLIDTEGHIEYVPPPQHIKDQMIEGVHSLIQNIGQAMDQEISQAQKTEFHQEIAIIMYNLIVYAHLFADGNGRTARLAYSLLTPRKKHLKTNEFQKILISRSPDIQQYHRRLDDSIYLSMLVDRGMKLSEDMIHTESGKFTYVLRHSQTRGFDSDELGFISAFDAMTEQERQQYAHYHKNKNSYYFVYDELPHFLQQKVSYQHFQTRTDLAGAAIFSVPFDKFIMENLLPCLDRAWAYEESAPSSQGPELAGSDGANQT